MQLILMKHSPFPQSSFDEHDDPGEHESTANSNDIPQYDPRVSILFCRLIGGTVGAFRIVGSPVGNRVGEPVGGFRTVGAPVGGLVIPVSVGAALSLGPALSDALGRSVGIPLVEGVALGTPLGSSLGLAQSISV
mmetsp:Transcript_26704/g.43805  ORF Transcript_26704/g.43805 Transcript_26704/m.43805 type:complete len:135 (-) Transcript_26704:892-1296(-)